MKKMLMLSLFVSVVAVMNASGGSSVKVEAGYAVRDDTFYETLTFPDVQPVRQLRTVIDIPQDYGKLLHVSLSGTVIAYTFEAGDGRIRTVQITETRPYVIRRSGRLE